MGRASVVAVAASLAVLVAAGPALASDKTAFKAWRSNDKQLDRLFKQQSKALDRWRTSEFKRAGPVLRVAKRIRRVFRRNTRKLRAQKSSTGPGAKARRYALRSNASNERAIVYLAKGVRLVTAGKRRAGLHRMNRAARYADKGTRQDTAGRHYFKLAKKLPAYDG